MGTRPVVQSVSMSVWGAWVPTWVVSIKNHQSMTLGLALSDSIKLRRVNMIPRRLVNARQREVRLLLSNSSNIFKCVCIKRDNGCLETVSDKNGRTTSPVG
ncbi:hypothetical protein TNCV_4899821 [Trichonephila clavipes]|nr:hypothetical protein TNCV_4899821 [Trichonephila clavipes]